MSAQVTEAHIARARASGFSTDKGLQMAAQFIANNEAAKAERDQLRAERDSIKQEIEMVEHRAYRAEAELKAEQDNSAINEIELRVSRAIVSRIWVQLGSPTYEQLKGRSIYDLIDELKAERARLDWIMAGGVCMVQHTGGFHVSRLHAPVSRAAIDAAMKEETK